MEDIPVRNRKVLVMARMAPELVIFLYKAANHRVCAAFSTNSTFKQKGFQHIPLVLLELDAAVPASRHFEEGPKQVHQWCIAQD
ncbi:hypothetical protein M758_6G051800 [Ceratodon purpureus]|uniref:Uncharacterized protein n=1 Tax=Ceratodon purpureus TaxID=3225 RepID=A0A8T0HBX2_CERPU|nr:hypothetical protein KC19_6G054600 [Ceratodon purpureus]KAG0612782.1 hypothetical protein M758_6G051800 [Ceratodon purpureus]